ncbi:ATP-binding protein [Actinoplanes sp. NPDC051859]|uniref:ATP-binding protein n=1 Tax=Actinoplanes sp. NPDC051859 TaxID=3363909 RepID=UPI00379D7266
MDTLRLAFTRGTDCADLRQQARPVLAQWQSPPLVEDTLLVITELVQNVEQHTTSGGELAIYRHDNVVHIEVTDSCSNMPHARTADPRRIGGRGLLVVSAITTSWGAHRIHQGKIVWAHIAVNEPSTADSLQPIFP